MKHQSILFLISSFFFTVIFASCGSQSGNAENQPPVVDTVTKLVEAETEIKNTDPLKIKLADLQSACDYLDAAQKLIIALDEEKGDAQVNELDEVKMKKIIRIFRKMEKVIEASEKKYTEAELKECANYDDVLGKATRLHDEWSGQDMQAEGEENIEDYEL